jgi:uncharacterized protein (DUF1786 family)
MKILAVDVGTGTQDIFLYDSQLDIENAFKLVLPSPTMMVHRRIKAATRAGVPVLLSGVTMGGGPSQWAAQDHARAGLPIFATPQAARTFNDELDKVEALGIRVISEDEATALPEGTVRIRLADFDFEAIAQTFERFGVSLNDLAAVSVAVFDHGDAPPGLSDRQFRFDYLDGRIREKNALTAFAYLAQDVPAIMTRLQAVVASAGKLEAPLVVMDTAPAAVLGATFDPFVAARERKLIVNVGNFHTLAFRLGNGEKIGTGIEGVFEHHTGEITLGSLEGFLRALADGSLKHEDVFDDMGHGALVYSKSPLPLNREDFNIVVTGPRRGMLRPSSLKPYFAVPFGDMMIAGCFGLLAATADLLPDLAGPIRESLAGNGAAGTTPWDAVA